MMELPFTTDQFLHVFEVYNEAIWPAQILAYVLGLLTTALALGRKQSSDGLTISVLAVFWLWNGAVYHLNFFSTINTAAYAFAGAFLLQSLLFVIVAASHRKLEIGFTADVYGLAGAALIAYALVGYPALGATFGHDYPLSPVFGVAPCPTTIFTFGILIWARARVPWWLLLIPLAWSLVGAVAALKLGIREDAGLLIAGILATSMILYRNRSTSHRPHAAAT